MSEASKYISGLLNESWYDITEEYASLLSDWYGEDLSLFDPDDKDLSDAVHRLTRSYRYWRSSPNQALTPYEKLRNDYDELLELHTRLVEAYAGLRSKIDGLKARQVLLDSKTNPEKQKKGGVIRMNKPLSLYACRQSFSLKDKRRRHVSAKHDYFRAYV